MLFVFPQLLPSHRQLRVTIQYSCRKGIAAKWHVATLVFTALAMTPKEYGMAQYSLLGYMHDEYKCVTHEKNVSQIKMQTQERRIRQLNMLKITPSGRLPPTISKQTNDDMSWPLALFRVASNPQCKCNRKRQVNQNSCNNTPSIEPMCISIKQVN